MRDHLGVFLACRLRDWASVVRLSVPFLSLFLSFCLYFQCVACFVSRPIAMFLCLGDFVPPTSSGVEDVAAARVSFEKGHCAAKSRLQNVRDPFVSLQNVLQRAMGDAAMHASATSALKEREAERVEAAGDRRERLFSALRDVVTGNDETLSSRRPPLDATLERLGSLLDGQSRRAATVTSSIGDRLAGATAELGRSMRQGEEGLSTVMTEATFHLTNAWDSGRAVLDGFRSTLKGAIAEQNAGNASADVCAKSAAGARDLEAATTFAVTNMADVRDAIVTQVWLLLS